jgi:hypothetical protein
LGCYSDFQCIGNQYSNPIHLKKKKKKILSPLFFTCPHDFFFFVEAFSPSHISLSLSHVSHQTNRKITTTNHKKCSITDEFVVPPLSETQRRETNKLKIGDPKKVENRRPKEEK